MAQALSAAISVFIIDLPWFVLCIVPFYAVRKIERHIMALRILFVSVCSAFCIFMGLWFFPDGGMVTVNIVRLLTHPVMFVVFYKSFATNISKIVYVFLLEYNVATMVNNIASNLSFYLFKLKTDVRDGLWLAMVILLITALIYPLLWWFFKTSLRDVLGVLSARQTAFMCVAPAMFSVLTMLYGILATLIYLSPFYDMLFGLLIIFTGLTVNFVIIKTALDVAAKTKLEASMAAMEQQLGLQVEHYRLLSKNIEQTRAARHDLRHHFAAITGYAENRDYDGLMSYLSDYRAGMPADTVVPYCENYAVDVLVRHYLTQAGAAGAAVDVKLELPMDTGVSNADLCVVFGNLFENALHSCQRQKTGDRFIRARCEAKPGRVVLTLDNSTDDGVQGKSRTGQTSVRAVAQKYGGTAQFEMEKGVYKASVLLEVEHLALEE